MADPTRSDGEQQLPFYQVDVFSSHAYRGNPVAVTIVDRQNRHRITDEHMTRFARWTNLSETTFIFPGDEQADYSLRIFTPGGELPFAGHPTLGSCRAWLTHGGRPKRDRVIVQRCGVGLVQIKVSEDGRLLSFIAPPLLKSGTPDGETVAQLCKAMDVPVSDVVEAQWVANGPNSIALRLKDAQSVLAVKMADPLAAGDHEWGIVGPYGQGEGPDGATYEVRFFAPNHNIPEDPATGSFTAGLALWLKSKANTDAPLSFIVSQGTKLDRLARLHVHELDGVIWVGGHAVVCISGSVRV